MEILLEGVKHTVPDDATDDEIAEILNAATAPQEPTVAESQGYKEPPPMSERMQPEPMSWIEQKLARLPNWLLNGHRQMQGLAQGAADPIMGTAQLLAKTVGQSDGIDRLLADQERKYQAQRGNSKDIDWWRGAGNVASPANLAITSRLPVAAGLGGRLLQGTGIGAAAGAMAPITDSPPENYWLDKGIQTATNTALGGLFPLAGAGIGRVISPKGLPDVSALNKEGIRTTLGQTLGGMAKSVEDRLTSIPIVGDAIQAARRGGLEDMNKAMYNRVLSNFGEKFPKTVAVGQDALKYIHGKATQAYDDVFKGGMLEAAPTPTPNNPAPVSYITKLDALRDAVAGIPQEYRNAYDKVMRGFYERAEPNTKNLSGEALNSAMKHLRAQTEKLNNRNDGFWPEVRDALKETNSILLNTLQEQNPQLAAKLSAARNGWHDYAIVRDAASAAGARTDGIVTPAQLLSSVANTAKKLNGRAAGKGQVSEGSARMQDLAGAAQRVLPSKYPDSGTAGRLALGLGAGSAGAAFMPSALAGAGIASLPYLPGGRQVVGALLSQRPALAKPVAGALQRVAPLLSAATPRILDSE